MSRIISIHSFRGGTGKSNLSANLAASLAGGGAKVAVVDTDIQSPGVHILFDREEADTPYTLNSYLWGQCRIEQAAYDVSDRLHHGSVGARGNLYLVPSSIKTADIARVLKQGYEVGLLNDGFNQLIRALDLDYLVVDTHPGVNEETLLSIAISDLLILILRPDQQDFQGTAVTVELAKHLEVPETMLVLNKVLDTMDFNALREKCESVFGVAVGAIIPLSEEVLHLGSNGLITVIDEDNPYSHSIKALTELVTECLV